MYIYTYRVFFNDRYVYVYIYIHTYIHIIYIYIYIVFTTEGFFEVAIESWPECDLNP